MDGNRRWAKDHGLTANQGHLEGKENLYRIAEAAFDFGIPYLSIYAFSTENADRTKQEKSFLLKLLHQALRPDLKRLHDKNVRLWWLGQKEGLDVRTIDEIDYAERETAKNTTGTLAICFNYGGQQEIVDAVNALQASNGSVTKESIDQALYHPELPPLDLIIRTSGERRLSNFMLWRAAYAEFYFADKNWPDFTRDDLKLALGDYASRRRRFGK